MRINRMKQIITYVLLLVLMATTTIISSKVFVDVDSPVGSFVPKGKQCVVVDQDMPCVLMIFSQ
jgi:hypothetical protein